VKDGSLEGSRFFLVVCEVQVSWGDAAALFRDNMPPCNSGQLDVQARHVVHAKIAYDATKG
jgi:hypothetical protein